MRLGIEYHKNCKTYNQISKRNVIGIVDRIVDHIKESRIFRKQIVSWINNLSREVTCFRSNLGSRYSIKLIREYVLCSLTQKLFYKGSFTE